MIRAGYKQIIFLVFIWHTTCSCIIPNRDEKSVQGNLKQHLNRKGDVK
ncbi:MAG: YjbQ family protein [Deltaproteobacteria bacterium]|nr:YjbQ family protein [Deltaproteobacteria bacterium]MBW2564294.1 YjbQ family protein [Deltaproteobacteria bacterium]